MPKDPVGRYFRAQLLLHRGFDVDFDQHPEAVIRERLTRSFVNRLKISIFYGSINSVRHQRLLLRAKLDNSQLNAFTITLKGGNAFGNREDR